MMALECHPLARSVIPAMKSVRVCECACVITIAKNWGRTDFVNVTLDPTVLSPSCHPEILSKQSIVDVAKQPVK